MTSDLISEATTQNKPQAMETQRNNGYILSS